MGANILIADDLSFMRMIQKEILTERGYTIVGEAADGVDFALYLLLIVAD